MIIAQTPLSPVERVEPVAGETAGMQIILPRRLREHLTLVEVAAEAVILLLVVTRQEQQAAPAS